MPCDAVVRAVRNIADQVLSQRPRRCWTKRPLDEVVVKIVGVQHWLWCAVDDESLCTGLSR